MKTLLKLVVLLFCVTTFAQEQKVDYKKIDNDLTKATYYFTDNASIVEREGFFNKEGKLHGTWINYDVNGTKTIIANYKNGKKEGTWTYVKKDKINLVTYKNNKIVNVESKDIIIN
ncbi:hypothetical protein R3X25_05090 [Lutibacter sp. TH_r2]|uniref:hypothetical protein n=1 Tax=Lutibacter sp. TH_r2 TaxID=3082083 RepID=UPI002955C219|nr:hypothetical protein [Lutibacter sp. TH_r2]MDV7186648.1 hypothetical protein [Lutibacter sp. TH_r2]